MNISPTIVTNLYFTSSSPNARIDMGDIYRELPTQMNNESTTLLVKLDSLQLMNVFYNLNEPKTLVVVEGATNHSITIPKGNYSTSTLATTIVNLLNAISSNYSLIFDNLLFKYRFSNSGTNFNINPASTVLPFLGFSITQTLSGSDNYLSENVVDLSPMDNIYVRCNLVSNSYLDKQRVPIITKISVDTLPGNMIFYKSNDDHWSKVVSRENQLQIDLYDRFGNVIDNQGLMWSCSLKFCVVLK